MTTIKIVNVQTKEEIEREMNATELVEYKKGQDEEKARQDAISLKASQKAALLDKLGITDDDAKLLLS
jgi:hypothetical protein